MAGKAAHAGLRGIDDAVGRRDFAREIATKPAARRTEMRRQIGAERLRAHAIAVVHDQQRGAKIHQCESHRAAGAARPDQHDGLAAGAVRSEAFLEALAPAAPVEIVAGRPPIRRDSYCVDGADLRSLGIDIVEQRENVLLEWIGDIDASKASGLDRVEELRQPPRAQPIDVHEMVEALDACRRKGFREQSGRQRPHDVGADQPQQYPASAHSGAYLTAPPVMPEMKRSRNRLYAIATGTAAMSAPAINSPQKNTSPRTRSVVTPSVIGFWSDDDTKVRA